MTDEELANKKYFPDYLIVRQCGDGKDGEEEEWHGFVKDIKIQMQKHHQEQMVKADQEKTEIIEAITAK